MAGVDFKILSIEEHLKKYEKIRKEELKKRIKKQVKQKNSKILNNNV